jgi:hypothetical protein
MTVHNLTVIDDQGSPSSWFWVGYGDTSMDVSADTARTFEPPMDEDGNVLVPVGGEMGDEDLLSAEAYAYLAELDPGEAAYWEAWMRWVAHAFRAYLTYSEGWDQVNALPENIWFIGSLGYTPFEREWDFGADIGMNTQQYLAERARLTGQPGHIPVGTYPNATELNVKGMVDTGLIFVCPGNQTYQVGEGEDAYETEVYFIMDATFLREGEYVKEGGIECGVDGITFEDVVAVTLYHEHVDPETTD